LQHWDNYWQKTKTLNSFAESEQGLGYAGDIAQFWQHIFAKLEPGASILDLATGNGGLAVLALQTNNSFVVAAADKANIAPLQLFTKQDASYKYLQKIQFFGNMPSEALTFADEEFDMVISQFGFEYAEPVATLQQLHRILKPTGKAVALVHHADSFISVDCQVGLAVLPVFTAADGLLAKAQAFATFCLPLQQFTDLSLQQQQLLKQHSNLLLASFMTTQQSLSGDKLDWFNDIAKDLVPVLSDWRRLSVDTITTLIVNLTDFKQRLTDQLAASWNTAQIEKIQKIAEQQGFVVAVAPLDTAEGKLCWVFQLAK
jgi:ubiquinone/menaquinone biosynthesis C-methylase UbiE